MIKKSLASVLRMLCVGAVVLLAGCSTELLSPKGDIGMQERTLILTALGLMLIVVIPVIVMTLVFAYRFRASNKKSVYKPRWAHSTGIEVVVWTVPCIIVAILAVITWRTSHSLDPYKPLESEARPITVEVVSMDWKWLFIYPDYGVASINQLAMPVGVPVNFHITSDTVMNSFFIPQLGSQVYSMAGMETKVHLIASEAGVYRGLSANYSGAGFSDMRFDAIATTQEGFDNWIKQAKASPQALDATSYASLAQPSTKLPVTFYSTVTPDLFGTIVNKYMGMNMSHGDKPMAMDMPMDHAETKVAE